MKNVKIPKTYIFFDESGKPEVYSARGINLVEKKQATQHLVLAALRTTDHLLLQQIIIDCKAQLLRDPSLKKIFHIKPNVQKLYSLEKIVN